MKFISSLFLCFVLSFLGHIEAFDKVVIWGYKLHTHTHSYVHNAFFRAFEHMGYKVHWFDDNDQTDGFNFSNSLFITAGNQDKKIPIRDDCDYILHNCNNLKYQALLKKGNCILLQVYTDDALCLPNLQKIAPCIYYDFQNQCVYMPWATDLLPHEIEKIKKMIPTTQKERAFHWVGTIGEGKFGNKTEIDGFVKACNENGIAFHFHCPWGKGISIEENIHFTTVSCLSPAIVGQWQRAKGYIPCRIFKNISYGQIGITNSYRVWELFEYKIVYHPDTYQLFYAAKKFLHSGNFNLLYEQMDFVKTKHTYINRIETLLNFFTLVKKRKQQAGKE